MWQAATLVPRECESYALAKSSFGVLKKVIELEFTISSQSDETSVNAEPPKIHIYASKGEIPQQ